MTSEVRDQWAEQLPGPADTIPEATATLLRALPGDGFSPPAERVAAANALAGTSVPVGRDAEVERLLRAELDAFASGYWDLAPSERRGAWSDLSRRGADAVRLRELEPGLDVVVPVLSDPAAEALAGLIRELFVLPPRARAVRRNSWLREQAAHVGKWRALLKVVQRSAPGLITLDPRLRAALAPGFPLAEFVQGVYAAPIRVSAGADAREGRPSEREASASSVSHGWAGSAVVFGLFMIVKLVASLGSSTKTPNYTAAPPKAHYSAPIDTQRQLEDALRAADKINKRIADRSSKAPNTSDFMLTPVEFTPDEVAVYERYDREKDAGESPRVPSGYNSWDAAGRPRGTPRTEISSQNRPVVRFDSELIKVCGEYDRSRTYVKPSRYEDWVAAGRPSMPGEHPLIHSIP